ncbi:MAG: matrixin family metalloprotease, partial [Planctomycetota bacterium]
VLVASGVGLMAVDAEAINITIDYTYDADGFFSEATANGQQARDTIEAAAGFLSGIIEDTLDRIETPDDFVRTIGSQTAVFSWDWSANFLSPANGSTVVLDNPTIEADEVLVFVGARDLGGSVLGTGGPGGFSFSASGSRFASDIATIDGITDAFTSAITNRGEGAGDAAGWGGVVTFDADTNWNLDHEVAPSSGQSDLFSVAMHELVHVLGFGITSSSSQTVWESLTSGTTFTGTAAAVEFGGAPPLNAATEHWLEDTASTIFGTDTAQETLMDPDILIGTRQVLTSLDAAALVDLGWEITEPDPPAGLLGDYNGDLMVTASDYSAWRDFVGPQSLGPYSDWAENFGAVSPAVAATAIPEPTTLGLLATGLLAVASRRGRSRPC